MNMNLFENGWFAIGVVAIVIMIIVGLLQYSKESRRRYNWKFFRFVSIVLGVIFTVLLVKDSANGIIQIMDNFLAGEDDSAWSVILMLMTTSVCGCIFTGILYEIGNFAGIARRKIVMKETN